MCTPGSARFDGWMDVDICVDVVVFLVYVVSYPLCD